MPEEYQEGSFLWKFLCSSCNTFIFLLLQSTCAQYAAEKRDEEKMCDHLIRAAKFRDHMTSTQLIQKIINILTDKHGAWGNSSIRFEMEKYLKQRMKEEEMSTRQLRTELKVLSDVVWTKTPTSMLKTKKNQ
ncbi:hypothetical protein GOODEAATRI_002129 [Goodea atripinnis]|uniref:DUF1088 domain-containing protein n=1 Tax=Goodea atripinnis TaxID=208336 RepID=A0ABV0MZG4_9TELE